MLNYIEKGEVIQHTASAAISGGDVVVVGARIGVACADIANTKTGSVAMTGVYTLPKATGAITKGALVYWDADGNPIGGTSGAGAITTTSSSNVAAGWAWAAAGEAVATVQVKLLG